MISAFHHDLVARMNATQDLHFLAIAGSQFHFLLLVTFFTILNVDEVQALFFGEGFNRKDDGIFHLLGEQEDFHKRTRDDVALIVEAEGHGYIERTCTCRLAIRQELAIESFQFIHLIVIRSLEVGRGNAVQILVISF